MMSEERTDVNGEYVRITKRQFDLWKRRCSDRAEKLRKELFEQKSDSESETEETNVRESKHDEKASADGPAEAPVKRSVFRTVLDYRFPETIDAFSDNIYLTYQVFVTLAFLYNACMIPMRMSFPIEVDENRKYWFFVDYLCDVIYIIDMAVFQVRCQFIQGGNFMTERKDTRQHYVKSREFKYDILSLLPTDLLYILVGFHPVLRANRILKFHSFFDFNDKFEMVLDKAYIYRMTVTTCYLLYFIHVDACLYYYTSYYLEFKSSYIRCFFWAFMTTVTIGNGPKPVSNFEYLFQLFNFFLGLFIFSIVIGQVRDIVQANSADAESYRTTKNSCIEYMEKNNIPPHVQRKVKEWFEYTWNTQKILDEGQLLSQIPHKMHNEIASNVHMGVLEKVELFKGCDRQLLHDLVIKLHPVLYLPGDYICRKGEVGKEMYIISNGVVQVVGEKKSEVFVTLRAGTAFGEISLLAVGGANRRTANIYSPGFATLFILLKNDLDEVVRNYPKTQSILKRKAKKMLNQDKKKRAPPTSDSRINAPNEGGEQKKGFAASFVRTIANEADSRKKNFSFLKGFRNKGKANVRLRAL